MLFRSREEDWKDEIERDPLQYLNDELNLGLGDAIDEGYITVDEDALIEGAIDSDGIAHFLATQDGDEMHQEVDGVDYYIYQIN